ncbi:MAG TPA: hypothetical protein VMV03_05570 [Spirochaetia bacterium]|nr:hypothetical protein [Spirochaetia bacterium]
MKVCFINGSLQGEKASSLFFLRALQSLLDRDPARPDIVTVGCRTRGRHSKEDIAAIRSADAVVIAFPLFVYSLPGALTRLLEDWQASFADAEQAKGAGSDPEGARVYAIVNCAFARPETNREAIRVLQNFCGRTGQRWRFAISIGCGAVVVMTSRIPVIRRALTSALSRIAADILGEAAGGRETISVRPIIPAFVGITIRRTLEWRAARRRKKAARPSEIPV